MSSDLTLAVTAASRTGKQKSFSMEKFIDNVTATAVVLCLACMVGVIIASVVARYVISSPFGWAEQVAKYLMIWAAFLGASIGIKQGAHIAVNILLDVLPAGLQMICNLTGLVLTTGFLLMTAYQGTLFTMKVSSHTDPLVWEMSMAWAYAAIPVGAILMLVQLCYVVARTGIRRKMSETSTIS